jgi:ABC-type transport system substrate-binding protein
MTKDKPKVKEEAMFGNKKLATAAVLVMIASLVLAACAPTPETIVETVEVEKVVTQEVEVTTIVEVEGEEVTVVETQIVEVEVTAVPEEPTEVPEAEPETYRMGIFEDMTTTNYWAYLDPDSSVWNAYVLDNMHPALFDLAYPNILFVPQAATALPEPAVQEGDFWVGTIEMRPGIMWSDGEEVTVNDLVFTGETALEFGLGGNWLDYFSADYIDRFEAVDDYTLRVYFKQEPGLSIWGSGNCVLTAPMAPEHFWADTVAECRDTEDPATCLYATDGSGEPSAGPLVFTQWEPGAFAEITANPDYYWQGSTWSFYPDGSFKEVNPNGGYEYCIYGECSGEPDLEYTLGPHVPNTIYNIYGTQDAAVLALANGEVDFLLNPLGLQRGLRDQVVGNPDLAAFQNPSNGFRYLAFNVRKSPNDSTEFRQAVATLIDKEYITNNVLQGTALPVYGMVPEGNAFWYNPDAPTLGQGMTRQERLEQAMELLKSAGFSWDVEPSWDEEEGVVVPGSTLKDPDGNELAEIELLAPSAGYDPMRATAAIWIAQWMNEVGIPVNPNPTGFNTIIPLVFQPDPETGEIEFDWYILGWSLGNPALPTFHESFFACANDAKEGGNNTPGYCNEEFDAAVAAMNASKTLEEARQYVHEMDNILAEDVPYVTLFTAPILEFYAEARVGYPFTETLDGLQGLNGMPDLVQSQ